MRPLNRPMFRMGGPIKEGIMDGMQDRRAALVGDPLFPKDQSGRGMYSEQQIRSNLQKIKDAFLQTGRDITKKPLSTLGPGKRLGFIKRGIGSITDFARRQLGKLDMPPKFVPAGGTLGPGYAGVGQRTPTLFEKAKFFARANPKTAIGGAYLGSGPVYDIATGSVPLVKKAALQIADIAVPDFIFDQDQYFKDKEIREQNEQRELLKNQKKNLKGDKDDLTTTTPKIDRDAEIEANRQRYYKILGIDKMKKDAAYDSLLDASNIVREEGADLKGAIKSGTLQSKIINAISKNLDKSADIKRQIDAAIVKSEIEKDIRASDPQAQKKSDLLDKQIKIAEKTLAGADLKDTLDELGKRGIVPEGPELASYALRNDVDIPKGHVFNTKDVNTFLKDNPTSTVVDFVNDQNLKLQQDGKGSLTPGKYVVGKNILEVGDDGSVIDVII